MALSNIMVSDIISELSTDPDFSILSLAQQAQKISEAQNEVANIYFNKDRADYKANNLSTPLPAVSTGADTRKGFGTANIAGTPISFTSALATPYLLNVLGYKDGNLVGVDFFDKSVTPPIDTRTTNGFTAFAADDGVTIEYEASLPL